MRFVLCCILTAAIGCANTEGRITTHWVHSSDFVMTIDRCIGDVDGREIIEIMHATGDKGDTWDEFENGAGYGDFETEIQAKRFASKRHPECDCKDCGGHP